MDSTVSTPTEASKGSTARKQALEKASIARAKVIAYLSGTEVPYSSLGDLKKNIPELNEVNNPSSLLATMVNNKLVQMRDDKQGYFIQKDTADISSSSSSSLVRKTKQVERPEVRVESDRIVIDHPRCRIIVELK